MTGQLTAVLDTQGHRERGNRRMEVRATSSPRCPRSVRTPIDSPAAVNASSINLARRSGRRTDRHLGASVRVQRRQVLGVAAALPVGPAVHVVVATAATGPPPEKDLPWSNPDTAGRTRRDGRSRHGRSPRFVAARSGHGGARSGRELYGDGEGSPRVCRLGKLPAAAAARRAGIGRRPHAPGERLRQQGHWAGAAPEAPP